MPRSTRSRRRSRPGSEVPGTGAHHPEGAGETPGRAVRVGRRHVRRSASRAPQVGVRDPRRDVRRTPAAVGGIARWLRRRDRRGPFGSWGVGLAIAGARGSARGHAAPGDVRVRLGGGSEDLAGRARNRLHGRRAGRETSISGSSMPWAGLPRAPDGSPGASIGARRGIRTARAIAFVSERSGTPDVWRRIASRDDRRPSSLANAQSPAVSPDGARLAFTRPDQHGAVGSGSPRSPRRAREDADHRHGRSLGP